MFLENGIKRVEFIPLNVMNSEVYLPNEDSHRGEGEEGDRTSCRAIRALGYCLNSCRRAIPCDDGERTPCEELIPIYKTDRLTQ